MSELRLACVAQLSIEEGVRCEGQWLLQNS